jgi:hypothetical protein
MREAARALDDVSDHLGEVLRHADALLAEWSRFGSQVQAQVAREVGFIGEVVDGAVARAADAGIDRAIADRLTALTAEIGKLELRARAASRAVAEQREGDRRVLWIVVAGIVLANVMLVAIWLRKPELPPVPEPVRIEAVGPPAGSTVTPAPSVAPEPTVDAVTHADSATGSAKPPPAAGSAAKPIPVVAPARSIPKAPLPHKP